eukprot:CAMPEP_0197875740 /NCGR_PEP_ID=MMETSP1439-20131203/4906_1 /TAXON_ID=66791 /ORGANISM="Gonyaulax spinifera, Strain CCMP409" /LENGTH=61 /DNA_ID=CAMNT_0043494971 /DNA_START=151 /DNA_END=336 /DNA_ORIENTATION=+
MTSSPHRICWLTLQALPYYVGNPLASQMVMAAFVAAAVLLVAPIHSMTSQLDCCNAEKVMQ